MTIFKDKKIYILDGAMGTQIMKAMPALGICFEELTLSRPDLIYSIHKQYVDAGADIIETNTFGGTKIKLKSFGLEERLHKINFDAVRLAKKAASGKALVAASMGPCGELLEPMGSFSFDDAYEEFKVQAKVFEEAGADLISIETISDIQEARAALIAVKQNTQLPVIVHLTYAASGKTISGTPVETAVCILESLGADAIGANCSTGPKDMVKIAKLLTKYASIPVSVMPNAGNPEIINDETVYKMTPEDFAKYSKQFAELGVKFIGGCCGTTPEHIKAIKSEIPSSLRGGPPLAGRRSNPIIKNRLLRPDQIGARNDTSVLASRTQVVEIGKKKKIFIIGERINPTNRKDLQEDLKQGKTNIIRQNAVSQVAAGADLLDINVGFPEIDEVAAMKKAVITVSSSVEVPVCIDSSNPDVLESGLKNFPGRALINSVNAKEESMNSILPLAKKYGAAIIGLTLDKSGIESKALKRTKIAEKIVNAAVKAGIDKKDIFIDVLTLSAGAQQKDVMETFKAVKLVRSKLKVKTSLGVSNVSHGLPGRKILNEAFIRSCKKYGLDVAIFNPENLKVKISDEEMKDAKNVFQNKDKGAKKWIEKYGQRKQDAGSKIQDKAAAEKKGIILQIIDAVIQGNKEGVLSLVEDQIKSSPQGSKTAQNIIDKALLPGIEEVGKRFNEGSYFIPQVMASAETVKSAFERVKKEIKAGDQKIIGIAVTATVLGDIHDIGKNIVSMLMENHGFKVIDLGKDIPPEKIVSAVKENNADIVMLSALLTTTMPQMKVVKQALEKEGLNIPVMVGGAPVTNNFANAMKANFAKDAISAVEIAKKLVKGC